MRSSLQLGQLAGIKIGIHYTWVFAFVLIAWSVATGYFPTVVTSAGAGAYWTLGVVAAGGVFILAGFAIINGYAVAGGSQADGNLSADAPFIARVTQYLLGLAIVGLLFAVFAWISFGSGERHFSSSISIPGLSTSGQSSERSGRIAFGLATAMSGFTSVELPMIKPSRALRNSIASSAAAPCVSPFTRIASGCLSGVNRFANAFAESRSSPPAKRARWRWWRAPISCSPS